MAAYTEFPQHVESPVPPGQGIVPTTGELGLAVTDFQFIVLATSGHVVVVKNQVAFGVTV